MNDWLRVMLACYVSDVGAYLLTCTLDVSVHVSCVSLTLCSCRLTNSASSAERAARLGGRLHVLKAQAAHINVTHVSRTAEYCINLI